MSTDLMEAPKPATQLAAVHANPIAPMLEAIMAKGITAESATTLEKMIDLYERVEAKNAERAFAAAFVALQGDVSRAGIQATKGVPDRNGAVKFMFAPYDEIMSKVSPLLVKNGFGVAFDSKVEGPRVVMVCTLTHAAGHSRSNSYGARIGSGPPNASEAQSDGAAGTYAKRRALCDALNIVVEHDTDARSEGDVISPEQAAKLEEAVRQLVLDPVKVLRLADAESFDQIREAKLPVVERMLAEKRLSAKPAEATAPSRTFDNPGEWRAAMLEEFAHRGAKSPAAAFEAAIGKGGYSSYLDVPAARRGIAWDALKAGKLDGFLNLK